MPYGRALKPIARMVSHICVAYHQLGYPPGLEFKGFMSTQGPCADLLPPRWLPAQALRQVRVSVGFRVVASGRHKVNVGLEFRLCLHQGLRFGFVPATSTISPGTSSAAGTTLRRPRRSTVADSASYALSSSIAFSALVSVITPTVAAPASQDTFAQRVCLSRICCKRAASIRV